MTANNNAVSKIARLLGKPRKAKGAMRAFLDDVVIRSINKAIDLVRAGDIEGASKHLALAADTANELSGNNIDMFDAAWGLTIKAAK